MSLLRRKVLPAVALVVLGSPLAAQTGTTAVGVTAGVNLSTVSGGTVTTEKRDMRTDFMGGVFAIYNLNSDIALQPELIYSRQGVKITDQGVTGEIKLSYVTVPVLLRFNIGDATSDMRPAVYVGPYLGFKAGCSASFKAGTTSASGDCGSTTINAPVKSMDFGATAGGELTFGAFGVFARYSMGLTSIDDAKTAPEDIKNRVITIGGRWTLTKM